MNTVLLGQHHGQPENAIAGPGIDDAQHVLEGAVVGAGQAGDHRVGVAVRHHAGGEHVAALVDQALAVAEQQPHALLAPIEELGVGQIVLGQAGIVDLDAVEAADAHALQRLRDAVLAADQDRRAQPLDCARRSRR